MGEMMIEGGAIKGEDLNRGPALTTFTGKDFYPLNPHRDEVDVLDIAHALGQMTRYTGHCMFYSVAEHSVLVSRCVPEKDQLAGLLHDATEAYVADLSRPMKRAIGSHNEFFVIEEIVWNAVAKRFGVDVELPESVKIADLAICGLEREKLHPRAPEWDIPYPIPRHVGIVGYGPTIAPLIFMNRFCELSGESFSILSDRYRGLIMENHKALRPWAAK